MSTKKRTPRLGRGLSSLMAQPVAVTPTPVSSTAQPSPSVVTPPAGPNSNDSDTGPSGNTPDDSQPKLRHLNPDQITPNAYQPRQSFDEQALQRLADSIKRDGLMQPIVVRPRQDHADAYELIAGERRWRAAQIASLSTLPALIRHADETASAELALIENLQREDLNPIEKAEAFERFGRDQDLTHDAIASRVGLERSTVANLIRLLSLCPPVRAWTAEGQLSMGQARALAGISDPQQQEALASEAIRSGLSVRAVEAQAKALREATSTGPAVKASGEKSGVDLIQDLSRQISDQLQTKASVRRGRKKHAGSITIEFFSLDQFDSLMEPACFLRPRRTEALVWS
ncbi:MAG: ParB/RepB/Spo0J family partition protein [Planctomycetota bacterium]